MGTPESVYHCGPGEIPDTEMVRAFTRAHNIAHSRTEEKREAALEQLRCWLEPMVEWLYKPVGNLLHTQVERKSVGSKTRVVVLFKLPQRSSIFSAWFVIDHGGNWVVVERNYINGTWKFLHMDGETLERMIWTWRTEFLGAEIEGVQKLFDDLIEKEPSLLSFARHACFVGFVRVVVDNINKLMEEREERLRALRKNLEEIARYGVALDPLSYTETVLSTYSLFFTHPGHMSRSSSPYLVREQLDQLVAEGDARKASRVPAWDPEDGKDIVYEDSYRIDDSHTLLKRIGAILQDSMRGTNSSSGREAFDDKEVKALAEFVRTACSFAKPA